MNELEFLETLFNSIFIYNFIWFPFVKILCWVFGAEHILFVCVYACVWLWLLLFILKFVQGAGKKKLIQYKYIYFITDEPKWGKRANTCHLYNISSFFFQNVLLWHFRCHNSFDKPHGYLLKITKTKKRRRHNFDKRQPDFDE